MKKLLTGLLLGGFLLCASLAHSANTVTDVGDIDVRIGGVSPAHVKKVAIDTVDTDVTVYDPPSTKMACIVGLSASEGTATNLTIKSGSTTAIVFELAANQGIYSKITSGVDYCTAAGEDLIIQSSAAFTSLTFYIIEAGHLNFYK